MREFTQTGEIEVAPNDNVVSALFERERRRPDAAALAYRDGDRFVTVSTRAFGDKVRGIAAGLIAIGIEPGDRVALFSKTRIEFTYCDYGILAAGAATVPIYETSSAQQVKWVIGNSGARALIVENKDLKARFDDVAAELGECTNVFVIDDGGLDELVAKGAASEPGAVEARVAGIAHDHLATLVYTSGTTGNPKGVVLTHRNFIWEVRNTVILAEDLFTEGNSTLMFLPLAHIFARVVQMACTIQGVTIAYSTGIKDLVPELSMMPPTWVFSVPRVFEKIYNTARSQATGVKKPIFEQATKVAIAWSKEKQEKGKASFVNEIAHRLFDVLVYAKLRHVFGGKLKYAISGGAPLGARLGHFFNGVGVQVLEGYGLTETTAGATINSPKAIKIGTVGRPFPGTTIRIADDGEVLIKGGQIMRGYWRNEEATNEAIDADGFFHSGDLGSIDADGFLSITGRKKELLITAGGKNVQPAMLEDTVRASALVSQAVVIGDAQPFIAALISLDPEELAKWAAAHHKEVPAGVDVVKALKADPDVLAEVKASVDEANARVSAAEAIRTFRILDEDLTIEGGELTPTLKVKRAVVLDKYAGVVQDIYGK